MSNMYGQPFGQSEWNELRNRQQREVNEFMARAQQAQSQMQYVGYGSHPMTQNSAQAQHQNSTPCIPVTSIDEAKAYPMPSGASLIFVNAEADCFYVKGKVDGSTVIKTYRETRDPEDRPKEYVEKGEMQDLIAGFNRALTDMQNQISTLKGDERNVEPAKANAKQSKPVTADHEQS